MTLAESLAELGERTALLSSCDDELSKLIVAIEEALRRYVTSRISVAIGKDADTVLAFGKVDGKWRLVIERAGHETPLVSCSREVRARVFKERNVTQMIVDAVAAVQDQIDGRKQAIAEADALLELLSKGAQP